MCHRRGEWSRTANRAAEPEDDRESEEASWGARAKHRLASLLSVGGGDGAADDGVAGTPRPTTESEPEMPSVEPERDETESGDDAGDPATEDEREEEPIPADD